MLAVGPLTALGTVFALGGLLGCAFFIHLARLAPADHEDRVVAVTYAALSASILVTGAALGIIAAYQVG